MCKSQKEGKRVSDMHHCYEQLSMLLHAIRACWSNNRGQVFRVKCNGKVNMEMHVSNQNWFSRLIRGDVTERKHWICP